MNKGDTVDCIDSSLSVGGLKEGRYKIELVSPAGYLWLEDKTHHSGKIGPYEPKRFQKKT